MFYRIIDSFTPKPMGKIGSLIEKIRGTSIKKTLLELNSSDKFNRIQLNDYRDMKFSKLVNYVVCHSTWYSRFWKSQGNINFNDLTILDFPILTKENFREGQKKGLIATNIKSMQVDKVASGGTSGDPIRLLISRQSRNMAGASILRFYKWWNVELGDRMGVLWGRQSQYGNSFLSKLRRELKLALTRRYTLNTFYSDDIILQKYYSNLRDYDPVILRGYANSVYLLALFIKKNKLSVWPSIKFVTTTSERLSDKMKTTIERVFNVPVGNQYGCSEVQGVAYECPEGRQMHVVEEHVILEVVDEKGNSIENEPGRILITDLDNYSMPLIRYEMGDTGIMTRKSCKCGRSHYVLKEVVGRLSDALELENGRNIAPSYWSVLLREYPEILQGCVRVMSQSYLQVDLVMDGDLDASKMIFIKNAVTDAVGEGVKVEWRIVDKIPKVQSGKTPWVRYPEEEINL